MESGLVSAASNDLPKDGFLSLSCQHAVSLCLSARSAGILPWLCWFPLGTWLWNRHIWPRERTTRWP